MSAFNHKMSASIDELLYNAASYGKLEVKELLEEVKELLSKGAGTGFRDGVS